MFEVDAFVQLSRTAESRESFFLFKTKLNGLDCLVTDQRTWILAGTFRSRTSRRSLLPTRQQNDDIM